MLDLHVFYNLILIFDVLSHLVDLPILIGGSLGHGGILEIALVGQLLILDGRRSYHQLLYGLEINFLMQIVVWDDFALGLRLPQNQLLL